MALAGGVELAGGVALAGGVELAGALLLPLALPRAAAAQSAALLPPTDPAYAHLLVLERAGLAPRGLQGVGPVSEARAAWVARDARALLAAAGGLSGARRADALAAVEALEARFGSGGPRGLVEVEGSLGRSPGRGVPDTELGSLDVVVNPLAAPVGGRPLGDELGAAAAARVALPLGSRFAVSVGARADASRFGGEAPGRQGAAVEVLSARAVVRRVAFEVGRSYLQGGLAEGEGLVLGPALPPLDMVRVATDRPLALHVLGDLDFQLFAADLGEAQTFPHAKLFGWILGSEPRPGTRIQVTLLSKQGGEGAPGASLALRLKDVTWVGEWLWPEEKNFSDKYAGVGLRSRLGAVEILAEAALTDVNRRLPCHTFRDAAAYRVGVAVPAWGPGGRHALRLEGVVTGPHVYRHQPFRTGAAVDGYPQGNGVGPDGRGLHLVHRFSAPALGWRTETVVSLEERSADDLGRSPFEEDALVLLQDRAEEVRLRAVASVVRELAAGRGGIRLTLGAERVRGFGFEEGARRWNRVARVGLWCAL